jgi:hypothetical protein
VISLKSYSVNQHDFSFNSSCKESPKLEIINNLYYLPNQEKPYSGEDICVYSSNELEQGKIKNGRKDGKWTTWNKKRSEDN